MLGRDGDADPFTSPCLSSITLFLHNLALQRRQPARTLPLAEHGKNLMPPKSSPAPARARAGEAGRAPAGARGAVQAVEGECVALGADSSSGKQAGGGRARAGVRWPRASVLLAEEGEDTGAPGGLGRQLGHQVGWKAR